MSKPKLWSSILNGAARTAEQTAEWVFEPGDYERVVKLPPKLDDKYHAIQRLMAREVELQAEMHRLHMEIERLQDAISKQLKDVGLRAQRP